MFETLGRFTYRRRRLVLALTGVFVAVGARLGHRVFGSLANGGFDAPDTEAAAPSRRSSRPSAGPAPT